MAKTFGVSLPDKEGADLDKLADKYFAGNRSSAVAALVRLGIKTMDDCDGDEMRMRKAVS